MRYGYVAQSGHVSAQVIQVTNAGSLIGRRAFVQNDGAVGSYMEEFEDIEYDGELFESEAKALEKAKGA